jgi:5-methylcytosine-specific restriction protein A
MPFRPPVHQPPHGGAAANRQAHDRWRGSAASRGYDAAWRRFRIGFLKANPLCADCLRAGILTPATEVHHVRKLRGHPEFRLFASHVEALCKRCHSTRTANGE